MTHTVTHEEWRLVVGQFVYEVSDLGRIRSKDHDVFQRSRAGALFIRTMRGRVLRPGIGSHGYPTVAIGKGDTRLVHQMVAEAFVGPCPQGQEVRHKDGDRQNPRADNLHYGTRTQNIADAVRHGTWNSEARLASYERMRNRSQV